MAKGALLPQNDNLVQEKLKPHVGRSVFDLSHSTMFPVDLDGAILPICCIETVPSDSFEISVEILLRQLQPLLVPTMTNLRVNTAFYYCSNRLGWKKFDRFMQGGRSGNEVYQIPTMYNQDSVFDNVHKKYVSDLMPDVTQESAISQKSIKGNSSSLLHTYFNISHNIVEGNTGTVVGGALHAEWSNNNLPLAFPFFDYQLICRDFYTNVDRLPDTPTIPPHADYSNPFQDWSYDNLFPQDDDEFRLHDGPQDKCGFVSGDDTSQAPMRGCYLDKIRYHDFREDYFTSSKKAPMRGTIPTIDTSISSSIDASNAVTNITGSNTLVAVDSSGKFVNGNTVSFSNFYQDDGLGALDGSLDPNNIAPVSALQTALSRLNVSNTTVKAIKMADIMLLNQLTVWQTLNILHKPYYNDFLNAHFDNIKVGDSQVEMPQFIGGTSQIININEVLQQSASTESSPLGSQGAVASSYDKNYVGSYYCNDYGYIIGVMYIIPDITYLPAMPRGFSKRSKEQFYSPEFANLSMEAILNKEIFVNFGNTEASQEYNEGVFGYTGIFDYLRSIPNYVAGGLVNSYDDFKHWTLSRKFALNNTPAMTSKFLSIKDNIDLSAWAVPNAPKFMFQCANHIKAVRPMPYVAVPKLAS